METRQSFHTETLLTQVGRHGQKTGACLVDSYAQSFVFYAMATVYVIWNFRTFDESWLRKIASSANMLLRLNDTITDRGQFIVYAVIAAAATNTC